MEFDFTEHYILLEIDPFNWDTLFLYVFYVEITKTLKFMLRKPVIVREKVRPSRIHLNIQQQ